MAKIAEQAERYDGKWGWREEKGGVLKVRCCRSVSDTHMSFPISIEMVSQMKDVAKVSAIHINETPPPLLPSPELHPLRWKEKIEKGRRAGENTLE